MFRAKILFCTVLLAASVAHAAQPLPTSFHSYSSSAEFTSAGSIFEGTKVAKGGGAITYGNSIGTYSYTDPYGTGTAQNYSYARWTSPWFMTGFGFTELVASWNAQTPAGTWIQVEMQATRNGASTTKWYIMGRWTFDDATLHRTSVGGQGDQDGYIAIDTFFAKDHPMAGYRLRVTLFKSPGSNSVPTVDAIGAVASDMPNAKPYVPSPLGGAEGMELPVPRYSQEIHAGEYPQFDSGGEAWCSPT